MTQKKTKDAIEQVIDFIIHINVYKCVTFVTIYSYMAYICTYIFQVQKHCTVEYHSYTSDYLIFLINKEEVYKTTKHHVHVLQNDTAEPINIYIYMCT